MLILHTRTPRAVLALLVVLLFAPAIDAQTSAFTYQGRLTDTSMPASGMYHMRFALYDAVTGGTEISSAIENAGVAVSNGVFTVQLDYGAGAFPGADRYLEISVRRNSSESYVALNPRQRVTSGPHAIRASNAGAADSLSPACVLCVTDSQIGSISGSKVSGQVASSVNADSAQTANAATTAGNVTGVVAIANGGTGSTTKNFVDLTTSQSVSGTKNFSSLNWGSTPPGGLLGQPLTTVFSTGGVSPGASFVQIPGLTVTISLPAVCSSGSTTCAAYVSADGGILKRNRNRSRN